MREEIVYLDDNHNIVDESVATSAIVHLYDENGNLVEESFLTKTPTQKHELTPEEKKFLEEFDEKYGSNLEYHK